MRSVPVVVTLAEPLHALVSGEAEAERARARIARELTDAIEAFGVDATPEIRFEPATGALRGQPARVTVDGQPCLVPPQAAAEALAYALGHAAVRPGVSATDYATRPDGTAVGATARHEALALLCRAALSARPDALIRDDPELAAVLALGVSIRNPDLDTAVPVEHVRDRLIDSGAAATLDLHVEPAYFEALTRGRDGAELFSFARDGMFVELGVVMPPMHVRLDRSLRPGGFAFGVNAIRTTPRIGLGPGLILVNETAERLGEMGVAAIPAANPATFQEGGIVKAGSQELLEKTGLTVWDPFGYFILTLAQTFRTHAHALTTPHRMRGLLTELGKAFPAVAHAAARDTPLLFAQLRSLLAEQISIRDLRRIVDRVVRYTVAPELVGDSDLTSFVRAGLAAQIAHKAARGSDTVVVYLLDPAFEHELMSDPGPDVAEELREALYAELSGLPGKAMTPRVLTDLRCRAQVRDILQVEFPAVGVLSYDDIPAHYNIQPMARISR